jgi:uncharacterized protein YpmS
VNERERERNYINLFNRIITILFHIFFKVIFIMTAVLISQNERVFVRIYAPPYSGLACKKTDAKTFSITTLRITMLRIISPDIKATQNNKFQYKITLLNDAQHNILQNSTKFNIIQ